MSSTRLIFSLLAGLTAFGLVAGAAASLTVTSADVGASTDVVSACDPDGVDVAFVPDLTDITKLDTVDVSGIHDDCDTLTVYVRVGGVTASGVVTATGTDDAVVSLDLSASSLDLSSLTSIDVTIA